MMQKKFHLMKRKIQGLEETKSSIGGVEVGK